MKVLLLITAVAMATAQWQTLVLPSAPVAHLPFTGLTGTFPTLYTGAHQPIVYTGQSNIFPLVYSAVKDEEGKIVKLEAPSDIVSPAIVPKYFSETKGAQHIVN